MHSKPQKYEIGHHLTSKHHLLLQFEYHVLSQQELNTAK